MNNNNNIVDEVRGLFDQSKAWLKLEIEYAKLTVAEKLTVLLGAMFIGLVSMMLGLVILVLFICAVIEAFKLIMTPALAYVSTAGIIIVFLAVLFLLRKPLILNPIARLITQLLFEKKK